MLEYSTSLVEYLTCENIPSHLTFFESQIFIQQCAFLGEICDFCLFLRSIGSDFLPWNIFHCSLLTNENFPWQLAAIGFFWFISKFSRYTRRKHDQAGKLFFFNHHFRILTTLLYLLPHIGAFPFTFSFTVNIKKLIEHNFNFLRLHQYGRNLMEVSSTQCI